MLCLQNSMNFSKVAHSNPPVAWQYCHVVVAWHKLWPIVASYVHVGAPPPLLPLCKGVQFYVLFCAPSVPTVQFMLENLVGAVLIFTTILWIPASCLVHFAVSDNTWPCSQATPRFYSQLWRKIFLSQATPRFYLTVMEKNRPGNKAEYFEVCSREWKSFGSYINLCSNHIYSRQSIIYTVDSQSCIQ